jgi:hypothetical protein
LAATPRGCPSPIHPRYLSSRRREAQFTNPHKHTSTFSHFYPQQWLYHTETETETGLYQFVFKIPPPVPLHRKSAPPLTPSSPPSPTSPHRPPPPPAPPRRMLTSTPLTQLWDVTTTSAPKGGSVCLYTRICIEVGRMQAHLYNTKAIAVGRNGCACGSVGRCGVSRSACRLKTKAAFLMLLFPAMLPTCDVGRRCTGLWLN